MTRVPGPPREDEPELPRYDVPLCHQDTAAPPRYRTLPVAYGAGVTTCSVCAALVVDFDGQRQHTEYHRLLGGALEALAERPVYGVRRL